MSDPESKERFAEQVERAKRILDRDLSFKTLEQVNQRIDELVTRGQHTTANNVRAARRRVFGS